MYLCSGWCRCCSRPAEEPEPLDVLGSGRQEELFSYELQSAQPEPMESNVAANLQFREERLYLFPLMLCIFELLCSSEISRDAERLRSC